MAQNTDPLAVVLRQERIKQQRSQGEVAEKVGTSREQLCRWELGYNEPGLSALRRWAVALHVAITAAPAADAAAEQAPTYTEER